MDHPKPKKIRKAAGLSLIAAAVGAGVAEATARVYELDPDAVSAVSRAKLDAYYATLRQATAGQARAAAGAQR